jgi:F0F1-type ATP synthase membrane subunit b/b'
MQLFGQSKSAGPPLGRGSDPDCSTPETDLELARIELERARAEAESIRAEAENEAERILAQASSRVEILRQAADVERQAAQELVQSMFTANLALSSAWAEFDQRLGVEAPPTAIDLRDGPP